MKNVITNKNAGSGNDTFTVRPDSINEGVRLLSQKVKVSVNPSLYKNVLVKQKTFLQSIPSITNHIGVYNSAATALFSAYETVRPSDQGGAFARFYFMHKVNGYSKYPVVTGPSIHSPKYAFAILNGNYPSIDSYNDNDSYKDFLYKGGYPLSSNKIVWTDPFCGNNLSTVCYIPDSQLSETELRRRSESLEIFDSASPNLNTNQLSRLFLRDIHIGAGGYKVLGEDAYIPFDNKYMACTSDFSGSIKYKASAYLVVGKTAMSKHPYNVNYLKNKNYTVISETPLSYFDEISAIKLSVIDIVKYKIVFKYNNNVITDLSAYVDQINPIGNHIEDYCTYENLIVVKNNKHVCDDVYLKVNRPSGLISVHIPHAFIMKDGYRISNVVRTMNTAASKLWPSGIIVDNDITSYEGSASDGRYDVEFGATGEASTNVGVAVVDKNTLNHGGKTHEGRAVNVEDDVFETIPTITLTITIGNRN